MFPGAADAAAAAAEAAYDAYPRFTINGGVEEDPLVDVDLVKWKVAELKAELADRGLAVSGRKADLVARLAENVGQ